MDEAVIQSYRRLLREEFPNSGTLENPSIFIEAVGEKMIHCGNTGNYMQLYLQVIDERITAIKYLCACEPVANVAVEVMCDLLEGKTVAEAAGLTEESFYQAIGSRDEKLRGKILGLLELLRAGLTRHDFQVDKGDPAAPDDAGRDCKLSRDGTWLR